MARLICVTAAASGAFHRLNQWWAATVPHYTLGAAYEEYPHWVAQLAGLLPNIPIVAAALTSDQNTLTGPHGEAVVVTADDVVVLSPTWADLARFQEWLAAAPPMRTTLAPLGDVNYLGTAPTPIILAPDLAYVADRCRRYWGVESQTANPSYRVFDGLVAVPRLHVNGECVWGQWSMRGVYPRRSKRRADVDDQINQQLNNPNGLRLVAENRLVCWGEPLCDLSPRTARRMQRVKNALGCAGFILQTSLHRLQPHVVRAFREDLSGVPIVIEVDVGSFDPRDRTFLGKPFCSRDESWHNLRECLRVGFYVVPRMRLGIPGSSAEAVISNSELLADLFEYGARSGNHRLGLRLSWLAVYPATTLERWVKARFGHVSLDDRSEHSPNKTWLTSAERREWMMMRNLYAASVGFPPALTSTMSHVKTAAAIITAWADRDQTTKTQRVTRNPAEAATLLDVRKE